MSIFNKLFKTQEDVSESGNNRARGLLIYNSVNDVIQAESALKKSGYEHIKVVAPPPQYRTGCDLSIEFPIIEQIGIIRVLENIHLAPVDLIHVVDESLRPTEICRMKDFGEYIMVRAANMKITFNKNTHTIVNISGGGCSDVPYLASEMIGKTLADAPSPRDIGYTLCAYTLAIAFDEARKQAGIS